MFKYFFKRINNWIGEIKNFFFIALFIRINVLQGCKFKTMVMDRRSIARSAIILRHNCDKAVMITFCKAIVCKINVLRQLCWTCDWCWTFSFEKCTLCKNTFWHSYYVYHQCFLNFLFYCLKCSLVKLNKYHTQEKNFCLYFILFSL